MKYLIVLIAALAFVAAEKVEEKKQTKRGFLDFGYGAHDNIFSEHALSLGHADLSLGSHYDYASAPLLKSYVAPAPTLLKSYAAPVLSYSAPSYSYAESAPLYAKSYSAPAVSYAAPAPIYAKSYAAPALSYAAPAIVKSYAAPVISKAYTYSAPAPVYAKSYSAPLSLGYSSSKYWIEENFDEKNRKHPKLSEIICSARSLSKYEKRSLKTLYPQICAAAIAASYLIVVGMSLGFSGILIPHLITNTSNINSSNEIVATKSEISWIASAFVIADPVGSITAGFLMDSCGRLNTLKLAAVPGIIGWAVIAMATNVRMLIIGRLLTGLAAAWGSTPFLVYATEIARPDMRGSLFTIAAAFDSLGIVLAFLEGWFLNWRTVAWLCLGYSVIPMILITLFIPESPAWLVSKGKVKQAAKSLKWLHKNQPQPEQLTESLAELQLKLLQTEHQRMLKKGSKKGTGLMVKAKEFFKPTGYKPLIILFGLFFFQQFSGIYILLVYSVTFFEQTGSTVNSYLSSSLMGTLRIVMACFNAYSLKTIGRRPLIMVSSLGMCLCMGLSGLCTMWTKDGSTTQTWMPTVLLLLYCVSAMIGLLPVPWTMTAELFPIEIRGMAHSIACSVGSLVMFASIQIFYTLEDWFGGIVGVQWFFAVVSILASVYAYLFLPETHDKTLVEINNYFTNSGMFYVLSKNKTPAPEKKHLSRVPREDIVKSSVQGQKLLHNV